MNIKKSAYTLARQFPVRNKTKAILFVVVLSGVMAFTPGCSKKERQILRPVSSPMAAYIHFEYAVYMVPIHRKEPRAALRHALANQFSELKLVSELLAEPREMMVRARTENNVQREYAPPSVETLHYSGKGLSDQQKSALQGTREVFILKFAHPKEKVWTALYSANVLIEEIARDTGGLIWDAETREVYSTDAWHKERVGNWKKGVPDISNQIVIHVYQNGEFLRAISLGMSKAGLPDALVDELPEMSTRQVVDLINSFAQFLAEGRAFQDKGEFKLDLRAIQNVQLRDAELKFLQPNGTGIACLTLKKGSPEEGNPENQIVELGFDRYEGNDRHAKQEAALDWLFGWRDAVRSIDHTEELLAESQKEKSNLPQLHKDFDAGLLPGEYILVKAPFEVRGGGREWMWVEIRAWKGHAIRGILQNQPESIPELRSGQVVAVKDDDVFDYIRHHPDGHEEGNTTGALIQKIGPDEKAAEPKGRPPDCVE